MKTQKTTKTEKNKDTVRVILNLSKDLDEEFTKLAKKRGITKSSMIIYSMSWFLDYNQTIEFMPKFIELFRKPPENFK